MYDDAAVDSLLDRTQEGIEEKESWANEYLSSFKVKAFFREVGVWTVNFTGTQSFIAIIVIKKL